MAVVTLAAMARRRLVPVRAEISARDLLREAMFQVEMAEVERAYAPKSWKRLRAELGLGATPSVPPPDENLELDAHPWV